MISANLNSKGFTILEVMIALAILTFGILAVANMQLMSTGENRNSRLITESATFGAEKIEQLLGLSYRDSLLDDGTDVTEVFHDHSSSEEYTINWKVSDAVNNTDPNLVTLKNTKQIDVLVTWDNKGKTSKFESTYYKTYKLKR
ncbi:putative PilV [Desulfamplus magnetovallimortis]|uniref:Putative PilV n=1 Tax=Desulfamplus magnetovallimortis TaxID=1246637 RepID=A0A1W1HIE1_9BACT|nr:prepilin-type N-terminal cleavage/methylation domain-containing protein [Desulfamplus magnetovallimortis]SLM32185.1 putative PilV [Desulfamplus magnetovallimortis]